MPDIEIDGIINGTHVKAIFKRNQWFAKPNNHFENEYCVNCPHFQEFNGIIEVHEDSSDNRYFRKMFPDTIASGSISSGNTWVSNQGKDMVVLPMESLANGFRIEATASGSNLTLTNNSYCLMAMGKWDKWELKSKRHNFNEYEANLKSD